MLHQLHLLFLLMIIGVIGTGPAAAGEKPSFAGARLIRIAHGVSDISLGEGAQRQEFKITRWFSPYNGTSSGSTYRVLFREVDESTGKVTWGGIPIKWHSSSARQHPIYPSYLETMSFGDLEEFASYDIDHPQVDVDPPQIDVKQPPFGDNPLNTPAFDDFDEFN
tara:strand:+ start:1025 stop:1519 length:495 start_codon:yes stop_codon:yes gene_type:complete